ncbi:hypothetical protein ACHAXT_004527 [Thalassiosira profunda]
MLTLLAISALLFAGCDAFAPPSARLARPAATKPPMIVQALPESITTFEDARGYFYLWFFGGQGGATVALGQAPAQFAKFKALNAMADEGPTEGGETVGISPLCLYPRDLRRADLDKVFGNKLSVEQMVAKGPKPNYLSQQGYLCYQSFAEANKGCNPLTVRAVFDAISTGDNVAPDVAQAKFDEFSADTSPDKVVFKGSLLKTKLSGFASIAFLLFLLGPIVGSTCLDAGAAGWFPDWPGKDSMPWSLISPGFWTIPEYWI